MAASKSSRPLLFLVEDDPVWAENVRDVFAKHYKIEHFVSAETALEALDSHNPSIIILDYHLEGDMTGFDALKHFRKRLPESHVVMFSAQDDVQVAVNILSEGAYDYVVKGDSALNRLRIILRNLEQREALKSEVIELRIRFKRERLFFGALVLLLFIASAVIYLHTCPEDRVLKWDPFGVVDEGSCKYAHDESVNLDGVPLFDKGGDEAKPVDSAE